MITDYHARYYAYELTRRRSSRDAEKFGPSIFNAAVDLNPHQIDAALFAFSSPLSRGAILADEVGLGKTIEVGLDEDVHARLRLNGIQTSEQVDNPDFVVETEDKK